MIQILSWHVCYRVFQNPKFVAHYELIRRETVRSHKVIRVAMMGDSSWLLKLSVQQAWLRNFPAWAWMEPFTALSEHLISVWLHRGASSCAWVSLRSAVGIRNMLLPQQTEKLQVWNSTWSKQGNVSGTTIWHLLMDAFSPEEPQCCAVILDVTTIFKCQSLQPGDHPCACKKGLSCAGNATEQSCVVNSK